VAKNQREQMIHEVADIEQQKVARSRMANGLGQGFHLSWANVSRFSRRRKHRLWRMPARRIRHS
jgi:hypothetical protein